MPVGVLGLRAHSPAVTARHVGNFASSEYSSSPVPGVESHPQPHLTSWASLMFAAQGRKEEGWVVGADIKADIYADVVAL